MRCPSLDELPPPPLGKAGWPWSEASETLPAQIASGRAWPRISIITPSYNQGHFIEETIRSILLQGYPDMEYLIIDGGSTDNTIEVLRKYERWLTFWVSEADRGQAHAINKGLNRVTGSLCGWINSDDLLTPNALHQIAKAHRTFPRDLIAGDVIDFWTEFKKQRLIRQGDIDLRSLIEFWNRKGHWHQPGIFFPTYLISEIGLLDEGLQFMFDYDYFCRALALANAHYLGCIVASFRMHSQSKTVSQGDLFLFELCKISRRYWHKLPDVDLAGYRRHASGLFFCTGCHRLIRGEDQSLRFIAEGIKTHPFWALFAAIKLLPSWPSRRWRETHAKGLIESGTGSIQDF